jgi:hypothetical protein
MRKSIIIVAVFVILGLALALLPVDALTQPLVINSRAYQGYGTDLLGFSLPVNAGYGIVVFEWIGGQIGNQTTSCSYLMTPDDSIGNSFSAIGSCVPDGSGGAMEAYQASSATTATDTIFCNFQTNTAQTESCYAFNVYSPGTMTELAHGTGIGNRQNTTTATATGDSLLLVTAGLQYYCSTVVGGDSTFQQYSPPSACSATGYQSLFQSGEAGGLENIGPGGETSNFPLIAGSQNLVWSEEVVQVAPSSATSTSFSSTITSTIYTATIIGWLAPDAVHWSNAYVLIIFPLAGMVVCLMPFMMFQRNAEIGDKAVFPALFGLMIGAAAADLYSNPNTPLAIPFADTFVAGLLLFFWWWDS